MSKLPTVAGMLGPSDIAELAGVAPSTVSNWRKRHANFPQPVGGAAGRPVFSEKEVRSWLASRGIKAMSSSSVASLITSLSNQIATQVSPEAAAHLIHQVIALRHLSEAQGTQPEALATVSTAAELAHFASSLSPSSGVSVSELVPSEVADLVIATTTQAVASLDLLDLIETSDLVIRRLTGGHARAGGAHGSISSRATRVLELASWVQDPKPTVYDPACGLGQLLLELGVRGDGIERMVGVEVIPWVATIARIRFLLRGIPVEIYTGDALAENPVPELLADLVVVEPPLSSSDPGSHEWLQHATNHLTADGLALVLTRKEALFEAAALGVRRSLVSCGSLQGVIELPGKILQHVSSPLALWMLRAPKNSPSQVVFVDGSREPRTEEWIQGWVDDVDLLEVGEPLYARHYVRVSVNEVLDGDLDLSPQKWTADANRRPDEVLARFQNAKRDAQEFSVLQPFEFEALSRGASIVTLGELASSGKLSIARGSVPAPAGHETPEGVIDQKLLASLSAQQLANGGSSMRRLSSADEGETLLGDVVVSLDQKIETMVEDHGPHLLTKDLFVLRANGELFDPQFLAMCIEGPWNQDKLNEGSRSGLVQKLEVPLLPLAAQHSWIQQIRELGKLERHYRAAANATASFTAAALNLMSFGRSTE